MSIIFVTFITKYVTFSLLGLWGKTLDDIYFTAKEFYNKKSPEEKPGIKNRKIKLDGYYVERYSIDFVGRISSINNVRGAGINKYSGKQRNNYLR